MPNLRRPRNHPLSFVLLLACAALLVTLSAPADSLDTLPSMPAWRVQQVTSANPAPGAADYFPLEPGKKITLLDVPGPGRIVRLWCTTATKDPNWGRALVLSAYWDKEPTPSVEVPLADFFTAPFGEYHDNPSLLVGMTANGYYSYIPMPFASRARLEVRNDGTTTVEKFFYQVNYQSLTALPPDQLYFHSSWRRSNPVPRGASFTVAEVKGKGRFLGCSVSLHGQGSEPGFLEGDEAFYLDDPAKPAYVGTGVEDYFNCAWYFKGGPISAPLHGCTMKDDANCRYGAYRFHLDDAPVFQSYFRMTLGHGEANQDPADYSAVAYWYQQEPHASLPPLPAVKERLPEAPTKPPKAYVEGRAATILKQIQEKEKAPKPAWRLALPLVLGAVGLVVLGYLLRALIKPRRPTGPA